LLRLFPDIIISVSAHRKFLRRKIFTLFFRERLRITFGIKSTTVNQSAADMYVRWILAEWGTKGFSCIASAVKFCSLRVVLNFDVIDVIEAIDTEIVMKLSVSSVLHLLELLFCPHVETKRTNHAHVNAKASVDSRTVDANKNGVCYRGPVGFE